ncbi:DNA mismatch endonuclease Vsr [Methylobacterium sp. 10]|uniref:very short patch repair endonuclease n=1 Tax=Methylobacterium sp. 10 TaxID=1101191 RepID=UPI0009DEDB67|nr:DNA mismatch endonuclease Vsr [Methylobacterium sp. 10]
MTDHLSQERRSENMRRIRSKDTRPEMLVRRTAHGLGYRFKLHDESLPGKPDLVFPKRKAVIFVHGCFWHAHDCKKGRRVPKSNLEYWNKKRDRNKIRDDCASADLKNWGWRVMQIWECETKDVTLMIDRIRNFLNFGEAKDVNAYEPNFEVSSIP